MVLGTPFPQGGNQKKIVPIWKQEARDEEGRKRLHGAFTGGFTAGYHNTVGSREGWMPSQFISRKGQTTTISKASIEDFMDEEDLREFHKGAKLTLAQQYDDGSSAGLSKLRSKKSQLGWNILRKMGWKGDDVMPKELARLLNHLQVSSEYWASSRGTSATTAAAAHGLSILEEIDPDEDIYARTREALPSASKVGLWDAWKELGTYSQPQTPSTRTHPRITGFVLASKTDNIYGEAECSHINVPDDFVEFMGTVEGNTSKASFNAFRIQEVQERAKLLGESAAVVSIATRQPDDRPKLDVVTALNAQKGFMPYALNPLKDSRYRQLLEHFINPQAKPLPKPLPRQGKQEYFRELDEYVKAAFAFKPLSAPMASRFVSASSKEQMPFPEILSKGGLNVASKPSLELTGPKESTLRVDKLPFGKATHFESNWMPSPLLSKRFGLESPVHPPGSVINPKPATKPVLSYHAVKEIVGESSYAGKVDFSKLIDNESSDGIETKLVNAPSELVNDVERPAMEFFKSIFESDSEEETGKEKTDFGIPQVEVSSQSIVSGQEKALATPLDEKSSPSTKPVAQEPSGALPSSIPFSRAPATRIKTSFVEDDEEEIETILIKKKRPTAADLW